MVFFYFFCYNKSKLLAEKFLQILFMPDKKKLDSEDELLLEDNLSEENQDTNETVDFFDTQNINAKTETSLAETKTPNLEATSEHLEQKKESSQVEEKGFVEETVKKLGNKLRITKKKPVQIPQVRDEITLKVEQIMEEGLKDVYKELTPIQKQEFKIKGEQTAYLVRDLLKATHIKVKSIFRLLMEWLKMLPGINKFFLEQEAKIKTDKILALKYFDKK